jgi:hypothetical protein
MEPEVHIVERYMQLVKGCFTMTNIVLGGKRNREIDLLAFNPLSGERFHIEARVVTRGVVRIKDISTRRGSQRLGLDTLNDKFENSDVKSKVNQIFSSGEYRKVLVVWKVKNTEVINYARDVYNIEVWKISDILSQLMLEVKTKSYRDIALRTIQLIQLSSKGENIEQKIVEKKMKTEEPKFPVKAFVNAYGNIRLNKQVLSAFGVGKGTKTPITIRVTDDVLIIRKTEELNFPVKAFVNAYGFIHLSKHILSAFGLNAGEKTPITIDLIDDALIIRKV